MPQEVELRLKELLTASGTTQAELAKRVGVGKATMAAYCANRWTVLDRTVLERIADVLQCDVSSLLVTRESRFFEPYRNHSGGRPTCIYLRRPDAKDEDREYGRPLGHRDYRAIARVARLLENAVDSMAPSEDSVRTVKELDERLQNNCIVLGSPMVNAATDMAMCRAFNVKPLEPGHASQLPFQFRVDSNDGVGWPSSIIQPSINRERGIWLRDEKELLQPDTWLRDEFRRLEIKKGRDYAVIVIFNHQLQDPSRFTKQIVLAGFGGVGTEGAAMALVDHYRDLEPLGDEHCVWGAIEVFYRKPANDILREILGYRWRYRRGGRCPVALTFKKTNA